MSVTGRLAPKKLPRKGRAPIAVAVGWKISTTDGTAPPKLKSLQVEINRHGKLDYAGLPTCPYPKIQPASTKRALSNCRASLVGRGSFSAEIALRGRSQNPMRQRDASWSSREKGWRARPLRPDLLRPPLRYLLRHRLRAQKEAQGTYGTLLSAKLPKALRSWGNLTGIEMKLFRRYGYRGPRHSFLSSGCPAPRGFAFASFRLARASFAFNGGKRLSSAVSGDCRVRG